MEYFVFVPADVEQPCQVLEFSGSSQVDLFNMLLDFFPNGVAFSSVGSGPFDIYFVGQSSAFSSPFNVRASVFVEAYGDVLFGFVNINDGQLRFCGTDYFKFATVFCDYLASV